MEVYLDSAATTKPFESVIKKVEYINRNCYGNPSSSHRMGIEAEAELKAAAKRIGAVLGCGADELIFTSGGTESDNAAIFGIAKARAKRGKHIITTVAEHPAIEQPMKALEDQGYELTRLAVDADGQIDFNSLESAIRPDTILISIHHVNNETGAIQDIARAASIVKRKNPETVFHSDGVQAFGKLRVDLRDIDLYSISAHKLHALKGTGALYIAKHLRLTPIMYGGGQQSGLRSGTENTTGIAGFGIAAEQCANAMADAYKHVKNLKSRLVSSFGEIPGVYLNCRMENCSPYILNMSFVGIRAEVLHNALDAKCIYVSAGAACSSRKRKTVLEDYGHTRERAESAIRFSFSGFNTIDEIDYCIDVLKKLISELR